MSDYEDDYYDSLARKEEKKKKREKADQRKVVRYQDISDDEIRKQGGELLAKIVKAIPKHFNKAGSFGSFSRRRDGVVFAKAKTADGKDTTAQVIRIALSLRPSVVIDYVVGAFKTKGWGAKHTYNDHEGYDYLDLTLPEDWLKRVLCIGRYNLKVSEQPPENKPEEPAVSE